MTDCTGLFAPTPLATVCNTATTLQGLGGNTDDILGTLIGSVPSASGTAFPTATVAGYSSYSSCESAGVPTIAPSAEPSAEPTAEPTASADIIFEVVQSITGVSYSSYLANQAAFDTALIATIAASMTGISVDDILDFLVSDGASVRRNMRSAVGVTATNIAAGSSGAESWSRRRLTDSIDVSYTVRSFDTALSFDTLQNELTTAISDGSFDSSLSTNAIAAGATDLVGANSSAAAIVDTSGSSSSSSSSSDDSTTLVIIIVVVVVFVVSLVAAAAFMMMSSRKKEGQVHAGQ
mmetsp:Transcript_31733/g.53531  ORF Transcript_31733/g.53531 Transcript_31733/m.53531 type:complete len:293 (+) Transcript_31733:781-1659(+)